MLRPLIWRTLVTSSGITVLGLVNSILLSRWLGPSGRGEVAAAMLWPMLLVYLSSMGLLVSTMYFSSLPDSKPQAILNTVILLGAILSVITLPVTYIALPYLLKSQSREVVDASRLFLLVIPLSLITQLGMSVLQGRLLLAEFNWLRTIIPIGYLAGTVVFVALGRLTLFNILVLHLLLNLTFLAGTLIVLVRSNIRPGLKVDTKLAKQLLTYGAKVHVGNISGQANLSLAQVLMAAWLSPVYLGLYVVAASVAGFSQIFSNAVQVVAAPGIAQKESEAERVAVLQSVFRKYWLISLVMTIIIGVALPIVIPMVFGIAFKESIWPAEVLLLGSCIFGANQVLASGAHALGNPWLGSKAQLCALFVTVAFLYFLLERFGIMGAAIATTASSAAELAIVIYGLRRAHSIAPLSLFHFRVGDFRFGLHQVQIVQAPREP